MKTKRNNLKKFFKLRILFFGILVALWGCEKEEIPIQNEQKNTNNGDGVAKIENISFNQLPKEFIDNYIDYQNKTGTTILSKNNNKEALKREFKEKITKVTAENGVITYNVIPLKKENSNSLRKSNECEDPDPDHSVISMNIGADGTRSDLYQTDFYGIGTPFLDNNNSPNSRFNFFTNVVNLGFGGSLVNNNPSNSNITKCKKRRKGSGGGGLNINFRSFWDWIKGIFRSRGKVMHGGCPTTGIDQEQPGGGFSNMARFDDDLLYDFKIPLEASDFASKTRKTLTIEDFDCACEDNDVLGISNFLSLGYKEASFLLESENDLLQQICKCVKDNDYSIEIKEKIKADLILIVQQKLSPLDSCFKIDDCGDKYVKDKDGKCVKKPCKGDPVPNPEIAPQKGASGVKGALHGCTRYGSRCSGLTGGRTKSHIGIDIKTPKNSPVFALFDGIIHSDYTQNNKAGYVTRIRSELPSGEIIIYQYFHLQENGRLSVGTEVKAGDIIAYLGDSGNLKAAVSNGDVDSHVHIKMNLYDGSGDSNDYSTNFKNNPVNPSDYMNTKFDSEGNKIENNCN